MFRYISKLQFFDIFLKASFNSKLLLILSVYMRFKYVAIILGLVVDSEQLSEHVAQAGFILLNVLFCAGWLRRSETSAPFFLHLPHLQGRGQTEKRRPRAIVVFTCWKRGSDCYTQEQSNKPSFKVNGFWRFLHFRFPFFNRVAKMSSMDLEKLKMTGAGRAIAVLTSGGDAQGHYEVNHIALKKLKRRSC